MDEDPRSTTCFLGLCHILQNQLWGFQKGGGWRRGEEANRAGISGLWGLSGLFLVAQGREGSADPLSLSHRLFRRTDCPPFSCHPPQHASLLRPDWPRAPLNSWRLISFTKVKGHSSGGVGGFQTGGPFILQGLDWSS